MRALIRPAPGNFKKENIMYKPEKFEKINTKFGIVTVLECEKGKIMVMIDNDITATFNQKEFFQEFVLEEET